MALKRVKTLDEVAELMKQWVDDPHWDLEATEGFEEHAQALLVFRLQFLLRQATAELAMYQRAREAVRAIFAAVVL